MTLQWPPSPWLRRLLFLGGNLAIGLVVTFACILPVRELLADRDQEIIEQRMMLARFRAVAAQETVVEAAAKDAASDQGEFLLGKNEGVIGADLQTRLKGMVETAGAKLRSVRTLPAETHGQTKYMGSRIEVYGPLAAIHRTIYAIESAKPYLFVRSAAIRPAPPIGQVGIPLEPLLEAQLDIFGAVRIEAREP